MIALLIANAILLNELSFAKGPGGLRIPAPALEHYGRLLPLALPVVLHFVIAPVARLTALHWLVTGLMIPGVVAVNAAAGFVLVALTVLTLLFAISGQLVLPAIWGAGLAWGITTILMRAGLANAARGLCFVPPAIATFLCLVFAPPQTWAHLHSGLGEHRVEAGWNSGFVELQVRVVAVTALVPAVLEWWSVLEVLPGSTDDAALRAEGDELVVEYRTYYTGDTPQVHRIAVR